MIHLLIPWQDNLGEVMQKSQYVFTMKIKG